MDAFLRGSPVKLASFGSNSALKQTVDISATISSQNSKQQASDHPTTLKQIQSEAVRVPCRHQSSLVEQPGKLAAQRISNAFATLMGSSKRSASMPQSKHKARCKPAIQLDSSTRESGGDAVSIASNDTSIQILQSGPSPPRQNLRQAAGQVPKSISQLKVLSSSRSLAAGAPGPGEAAGAMPGAPGYKASSRPVRDRRKGPSSESHPQASSTVPSIFLTKAQRAAAQLAEAQAALRREQAQRRIETALFAKTADGAKNTFFTITEQRTSTMAALAAGDSLSADQQTGLSAQLAWRHDASRLTSGVTAWNLPEFPSMAGNAAYTSLFNEVHDLQESSLAGLSLPRLWDDCSDADQKLPTHQGKSATSTAQPHQHAASWLQPRLQRRHLWTSSGASSVRLAAAPVQSPEGALAAVLADLKQGHAALHEPSSDTNDGGNFAACVTALSGAGVCGSSGGMWSTDHAFATTEASEAPHTGQLHAMHSFVNEAFAAAALPSSQLGTNLLDILRPSQVGQLAGGTAAAGRLLSWLQRWRAESLVAGNGTSTVRSGGSHGAAADADTNGVKSDTMLGWPLQYGDDADAEAIEWYAGEAGGSTCLTPLAVLAGGHGVGKSAALQAAANELDYTVIEVSCCSLRSGNRSRKAVLEMVGEAVSSRRIHRTQHAGSTATGLFQAFEKSAVSPALSDSPPTGRTHCPRAAAEDSDFSDSAQEQSPPPRKQRGIKRGRKAKTAEPTPQPKAASGLASFFGGPAADKAKPAHAVSIGAPATGDSTPGPEPKSRRRANSTPRTNTTGAHVSSSDTADGDSDDDIVLGGRRLKSIGASPASSLVASGTLSPRLGSPLGANVRSKLTLLVFDEVDVMFSDDKGFNLALKEIALKTRCPIVLTTSSPPSWLNALNLTTECIVMPNPHPLQLWAFLQFVVIALTGSQGNSSDLLRFLTSRQCDIRACLNDLPALLSKSQVKGGISRPVLSPWQLATSSALASAAARTAQTFGTDTPSGSVYTQAGRWPCVLDVSPAFVSAGCEQQISVHGRSFAGKLVQVYIGEQPCTQVEVVHDRLLRCLTPKVEVMRPGDEIQATSYVPIRVLVDGRRSDSGMWESGWWGHVRTSSEAAAGALVAVVNTHPNMRPVDAGPPSPIFAEDESDGDADAFEDARKQSDSSSSTAEDNKETTAGEAEQTQNSHVTERGSDEAEEQSDVAPLCPEQPCEAVASMVAAAQCLGQLCADLDNLVLCDVLATDRGVSSVGSVAQPCAAGVFVAGKAAGDHYFNGCCLQQPLSVPVLRSEAAHTLNLDDTSEDAATFEPGAVPVMGPWMTPEDRSTCRTMRTSAPCYLSANAYLQLRSGCRADYRGTAFVQPGNMDMSVQQWPVGAAPDAAAHAYTKQSAAIARVGRPRKSLDSSLLSTATDEGHDEETPGFYNVKTTPSARRGGMTLASHDMSVAYLTHELVQSIAAFTVASAKPFEDHTELLRNTELLWALMPAERQLRAMSCAAVASELNLSSPHVTTDACLVPNRFLKLRPSGSGLASDRFHTLQWICRQQSIAKHASQRRRFAHYAKRRLGLGDASCTLLANQGSWSVQRSSPFLHANNAE